MRERTGKSNLILKILFEIQVQSDENVLNYKEIRDITVLLVMGIYY